MNKPNSSIATAHPSAQGSELAKFALRGLAVVGGVAVLTASAKFSIPFFPVPLTLQPLAVLLLGAMLGPRLGAATVFTYLCVGAAGFPVFAGTPAKGIGLAYLVGPTGGFLFGFLLSAALVGTLTALAKGRNIAWMLATMVAGMAAIYIPGILWLGTVIGWDKPVLQLGFYPFIYGDLLKIGIAALLVSGVWRLQHRSRVDADR
jgi:biotin transport system substrate-specific component